MKFSDRVRRSLSQIQWLIPSITAAVVLLSLSVCLVFDEIAQISSDEKIPGNLPKVEPLTTENLICLQDLDAPTVLQNPKREIDSILESCGSEFALRARNLSLTPAELRIAILALTSYSLAPYGPSSATSLDSLLSSDLDCDNYSLLTGYLNTIASGPRQKLRFVGFDGGAVGNHAQIIVESERGLLLDPTVGLIARTDFDSLLSGVPIPESDVLLFNHRRDGFIDAYRSKVATSVLLGSYNPSDLLYFLTSAEEYRHFIENFPVLRNTPPGDKIPFLPTPASHHLFLPTL